MTPKELLMVFKVSGRALLIGMALMSLVRIFFYFFPELNIPIADL